MARVRYIIRIDSKESKLQRKEIIYFNTKYKENESSQEMQINKRQTKARLGTPNHSLV